MGNAPQAAAVEALPFVISRDLAAPLAKVWEAFSNAEALRQWWGPKGFTVTASKLDQRPGGIYHYGLRSPNGQEMWGRFLFREVVARERLVFESSFSDEQIGVTRHPMAPEWPLLMLTTFAFEDLGQRSRVTVGVVPIAPLAVEARTFNAGHTSMTGGWGGTLDQLAAYLATA